MPIDLQKLEQQFDEIYNDPLCVQKFKEWLEARNVSQNGSNAFVGGSTVKTDCSRHKKEVAGITDMKQLAEMIGDLHYESLTQLFNELCLKINEDGTKDYNAGRKQLGSCLINACDEISKAADYISMAWQVSKPFMK